jgi:hypothetical protein
VIEGSPSPSETIAVRAARNQSTFRDANERLGATVGSLGTFDLIPFICECADRRCTAVAPLSVSEYEDIRAKSERFWVVPGHETTSVEGVEIAVVVDRCDRFSVLDKIGTAGEIARQEDPRKNAGSDG